MWAKRYRMVNAFGSVVPSANSASRKFLHPLVPSPKLSHEAGVLPGGADERGRGELRSDPMNLVGDARRRESVITIQTTASSHRPDTVVIGAGVIGLSLAWRLAQAGCRVRVYDKGEAGHGASWAAAGMLAATVETEPGEEKLLSLTLASQRLWPAFARELEAASGMAIGYRSEGTLVVALNRDDAETLRHSYEFQKGLGLELDWISAYEARRREPHLKPGLTAAVFCGNDHQVDNRCLALALAEACRRAQVEIHENTPVRELI